MGKKLVSNSDFQLFVTSDALDFVVPILNYCPSQKRLCSVFCSCKKRYHALNFVVAHRMMHHAFYLPKASAQLLPPYLNPDINDVPFFLEVRKNWCLLP
jgi:hypothetical protein